MKKRYTSGPASDGSFATLLDLIQDPFNNRLSFTFSSGVFFYFKFIPVSVHDSL